MPKQSDIELYAELRARDAEEIHSKVMALYETDKEVRNLYRGIFVWQSPIILRPEILFIGINPYNLFGMSANVHVARFQPKLIIFEGATAFNWFNQWSYEVIVDEKKPFFTKGHFVYNGNLTQVLQVSRVFSTLKGIDEVISEIRKIID